ncbi:MAG: hypothetical protein ABS944_18030 [Solibacillus sp.]|uniref:hypothetical protein n=1 Tax=unclassified Solibacillus TaxID=2637870 RepID=UPI0030F7CACB
MLRILVSLALCLFLVLFYFEEKNFTLPTFQMTETPTVITKGTYGHSLIIELSYSHKGLSEWITNLREPYPLFLIDSEWLERSPDLVKQLKEKNIQVGLLGSPNVLYEDDTLLEKQLKVYEKTFNELPLWFATADYIVDSKIQKVLHARGINIIAPSTSFTTLDGDLTDGEFVSIPIHREQNISFEQITQYMNQHKFISIEENIFGYKINTKRLP